MSNQSTLLKRPFRRDWLSWWGIFLILMAFISTVREYSSGATLNAFYTIAFTIDFVIAGTVNIAVFFLPVGLIRRSVRRSKDRFVESDDANQSEGLDKPSLDAEVGSYEPPSSLTGYSQTMAKMDRVEISTSQLARLFERKKVRRTIGLIAGIAILVSLDWGLRNYELHRLLQQVEASEDAIISGQDNILEVAKSQYSRLTQWSSDSDHEAARRRVAEAAGEGASEVLVSEAQINDVSVLPWHQSINRAKARYLDHSSAWVQFFEEGAEDVSTLGDPHPRIDSTFAIAHGAFEGALPLFPMFGLQARIEKIFEE